ncbi:MAG TPA: DUF4232 domain-containing protein [Pseudonocardia sp.]|jgi:hypothetical protein
MSVRGPGRAASAVLGRGMALISVLVSVLILLAGCADTQPNPGVTLMPAPAGTVTAVPPVERCHSAMLVLSFGEHDGVAAGTASRSLRFTNTSGRRCTLRGFPGVSYVTGDNGTQVGPAAERDGVKGPVVMMNPGATASVTVEITNTQNFDAATCHPTPVRGLRVYPPNERAALFIAMPGVGCAVPTLRPFGRQLGVTTIQTGPGEH